ncbi:MAG: hypothetical protein J6S63_06740 [Atopobiaceae bacterium]|nr:hypothetical protein [Atopobiaceae bacterium]
MEWKSFALGSALGLAAGAGIGYLLATRWEVVDEITEDPELVTGTPCEPEGKDDAFEEVRIAKTLRNYQPFSEDLQEGETDYITKSTYEEHMLEETGVGPAYDDDAPHVITYSEFDNENPEYDKLHLDFYPDYDLVVTEEEQMVDDPTIMLGEDVMAFLKERYKDGNPALVFVRNPHHSQDYEVSVLPKEGADGWIRDYLEGMDG